MAKEVRHFRVLPSFVVGYLGMIMIWPWHPIRFLVPILPLFLCFFLGGIIRLAKMFPFPYIRIRLEMLFLATALIANLILLSGVVKNFRTTHYPYLDASRASWSSYQDLFSWVKTHTNSSDVLACGLDTMFYLYTGRKAFRPFVMSPGSLFYGEQESSEQRLSQLSEFLKLYQPQYLIKTPLPGFSAEKPFADVLQEAEWRYPGWLRPVYSSPDQQFIIFKVVPHLAPALR